MLTTQGKTRFGIAILIGSIALMPGLFALYAAYPKHLFPSLYTKIIPISGIALSLLVLVLGHSSYRRVQNLTVFVSGYLIGLASAIYFLLCSNPFSLPLPPTGLFTAAALLLILCVNTLLPLLLPTQSTFRLTRDITIAICCIEIITLLVFRFSPHATDFMQTVSLPGFFSWPFLLCIGFLSIVITLSVFRLSHSFHLGGVFCSCALFLSTAWVILLTLKGDISLVELLICGALITYCIGILIHLFSRMEHKISYDPLLHIYNRNFCTRIITEQSSVNTLPPFTVAMLDIDHFKKVNDTYGHQAGDAVLHAVAQTVHTTIGPSGIVCRYGGEELAVFFPQTTTKEAAPILEKVRVAIEKHKTISGKKTICVTLSSGISHREEKDQTIVQVIEAADKALYKAKEGGRNQVQTGKTGKSVIAKKTPKK